MDRIDHDLGYRVWHEHGTADYGAMFKGSGRSFVDWVCATHAQMTGHIHRITNILIKVNGQQATSEAYVHAVLRFDRGGHEQAAAVYGRYLDRWSLRDGHWAIDHRVYLQDMDEIRDCGPSLVGPFGGRRDRGDPSYELFAVPK